MDKANDCWTGFHFIVLEKASKEVDWFRTTIPENINHYLEHRGLDADDVLGISVDGGVYYVFYKKTVEIETENLSGGSSRESSKGSKV